VTEKPVRAAQNSNELTLSGAVDPNTYRLGPGDLVQIQMWGRVARSSVTEVGPEGVLTLPGTSPLKVAGRTLTEVRQDVLERMKSVFRDVSIDVRLARPRSFFVYLTGQVQTPGRPAPPEPAASVIC
jgi:protein involved in polysaccharide export with SLBB domain